MATIRGYMGVSLDHYLASPDGTLDWLRKYDKVDFGAFAYANFVKEIRTVVMGRGTYDEVLNFNVGWPYADQRSIVVTSRPLDKPAGPLTVWRNGLAALIAHLRALDDGDVWIVGGGKLQQADRGRRLRPAGTLRRAGDRRRGHSALPAERIRAECQLAVSEPTCSRCRPSRLRLRGGVSLAPSTRRCCLRTATSDWAAR